MIEFGARRHKGVKAKLGSTLPKGRLSRRRLPVLRLAQQSSRENQAAGLGEKWNGVSRNPRRRESLRPHARLARRLGRHPGRRVRHPGRTVRLWKIDIAAD